MLALFPLKGHLSVFIFLLGLGLHFFSGEHCNIPAPSIKSAHQMHNNIRSAKHFTKKVVLIIHNTFCFFRKICMGQMNSKPRQGRATALGLQILDPDKIAAGRDL